MTTPHKTEDRESSRGVLAALRALIPQRQLTFSEALRLAELQAARLLELSGIDEAAISEEVVLSQPRIKLRYHQLHAVSGLTYWSNTEWVIGVNSNEPITRQRFTILHEYKHILDHGRLTRLYSGDAVRDRTAQAELVADFFAGCVLMPKRLLKQAWYHGVQTTTELARLFEVSPSAVRVRLRQLGLLDTDAGRQRSDRESSPPFTRTGLYFRSVPARVLQGTST